MSAVVDQDQVGGQEEDGHHVADDNLAVDVVQLWHHHVHQESHHQEDAADDAADGVDEPDGVDVTLKTAGDVLTELRHVPDDFNPVRDTLHHHLGHHAVLVPDVVHAVVAGHTVVSVVEAVVGEDPVRVVGLHGHHGETVRPPVSRGHVAEDLHEVVVVGDLGVRMSPQVGLVADIDAGVVRVQHLVSRTTLGDAVTA